MQALLAFYEHDSQLLSSFVTPFWIACLKRDSIERLASFVAHFERLLRISITKTLKVGEPLSSASSPTSPNHRRAAYYSLIEFESLADYRPFFAAYRNRVIDVLRLGAGLAPMKAAELVREIAVALTGLPVSGTPCTMHDTTFIMWEGHVAALEALIIGIPEQPTLEWQEMQRVCRPLIVGQVLTQEL